VNLVDIYGSEAPALGTIPTPDFFHPALQHLGWDIFGDAQDQGILVTFSVAKALFARPHTPHDDR
jgi:hypothetical protein